MAIETEASLPAPKATSITVGLANSNKTGSAIELAARLAEGAEDPSRVLFLAASATAAAAARSQLAQMGDKAAQVRVETTFSYELGLLGSESAQAFVGRRNRVLTDFEYGMLLEDMRSLSLPTKNIKGMLGFFQRAWTEMMDDDMAAFILDPREHMALDAIMGYLRSYNALLKCEVAPMCVKYLRANPEPADFVKPTHIVVDDYQSLNRASQLMVELLGPEELHVFADPTFEQEGTDPFPYPKGIEEFKARNPKCAVRALEAPVAGGAALAAQLKVGGFLDTASPETHESMGKHEDEVAYGVDVPAKAIEGVAVKVARDPRAELSQLMADILAAVEQGCSPDDILVVVPNGRWSKTVCASLKNAGMKVEALGSKQPVGGDFRTLESCGEARMYAALALLADSEDPLAWRVWCGCGDHVAHTPTFKAAVADEGNVVAALEAGAKNAENLSSVYESYRQGRQMIAILDGLKGAELLLELARGLGLDGVPEVFANARDSVAPGADAKAIFAALQAIVLDGGFAYASGAVRVGEIRALAGAKARRVYVAGIMNGWLPGHAYFDIAEAFYDQRQKMDAAGRGAMYLIASCAEKELVFSGFSECDLEMAERLKLKGYRVSMGADGRRKTTCRTSVFLDYALHAWGHAPVNPIAVN